MWRGTKILLLQGTSLAQKDTEWERIIEEVNALGHCHHEVAEFKHKWQDLRVIVKKKMTGIHWARRATGIFIYFLTLFKKLSVEIKFLKYKRQNKTDTTTETPLRQHRIKANITWKHPLGPFDIVYPYDYNYVINEPDKCKNKNPFLVLLIPTGPAEIHARNVIRETWGNETLIPGVTIIRLFFIGLPVTILEALQKQLEEESSVYHDIIQRDFLDTYNNLTIKTMTSLEWLTDFCPEAAYAMKVDADMFLNIEKLVKSLLKPHIPTRQNYFTGFPFIHNRPIRDKNSKWYIPESVFPGQEYAPYCSGTGYVFSVNIVWKILEASYIVKPIYLEDVYIGFCLNFAQITITHPPGSFFHINHVDYEAWLHISTGMIPQSVIFSDCG
ncbi:beta-1,3-galactosyltransferase 2-like [Latimeria chalumnae]|uniref:beta-1,3-galactosyltransferase 2-like n=1 Tax=Latimeria chalumnae TaxID=7897 RepID=UPI00313E808C